MENLSETYIPYNSILNVYLLLKKMQSPTSDNKFNSQWMYKEIHY